MGDMDISSNLKGLRGDLSPIEANGYRACVLSKRTGSSIVLIPVKTGFHFHMLDVFIDNRGEKPLGIQIYDNSSTISNMIVSLTVPGLSSQVIPFDKAGKAFRANCPVVFVSNQETEVAVTALGYYEGN